jgi:hypothetical protein
VVAVLVGQRELVLQISRMGTTLPSLRENKKQQKAE